MGYEPGVNSIVVNYRTPNDLQGFLNSYSPTIPNDLTIVNVSPEPADQKVALACSLENASYIEHSSNIGYGRAANDAALYGNREVLAIFNADVRVLPGSLEACYHALMENDDWAVVGPRQIDDRGRIVHAGIFGTNTEPKHRGWLHTDSPLYEDVQEAVSVSGSAYIIKRAVWDQLTNCEAYRASVGAEGAFLPTKHYYNETHTSYHARTHGWKVVFYGPALMIHRYHKASPMGGWGEQNINVDRAMFREACLAHSIECD